MQEREDHLIQATAADSTIRLLAAVTTRLVAEACGRHATAPTASAALGRTLTGAMLLGRTFKDLEYITVRIDCDGLIGGIVAEANAHGQVRGYVKNPAAHIPPNAIGKLDVRGVVGNGMLHVIREVGVEIGLAKEPYIGSVPIVSGEIAEDFTHYLSVSEQVNSACSLGVFVEGEQEKVTNAGGYLIQVMPGCDEETVAALETVIRQAPSVTDMLRSGADAETMLQQVMGTIPVTVLESHSIEFRCKCSYERAVSLVTALGEEEVSDMLAKDNGAELTCHFCNAVYYLDDEALRNILSPPSPVLM